MGLLKWLIGKQKRPGLPKQANTQAAQSLSAKAIAGSARVANPDPAAEAAEKSKRLDLLFGVVRETMAHAGVLSSAYKFKSLATGDFERSFILMIEMDSEFRSSAFKFPELETQLQRSVMGLHHLTIKAIFWRVTDFDTTDAGRARKRAPVGDPRLIGIYTSAHSQKRQSARRVGGSQPTIAAHSQVIPTVESEIAVAMRSARSQVDDRLIASWADTEGHSDVTNMSATQYGLL